MLGSLPEDLVSDLRQGELTFEVGTSSNLEVVVVAVGVNTLHNLSMDGVDEAGPVVKTGVIETVISVVNFVGLSEVSDVGLGETVVLFNGEHGISLKVLDFLVGGIIEVA